MKALARSFAAAWTFAGCVGAPAAPAGFVAEDAAVGTVMDAAARAVDAEDSAVDAQETVERIEVQDSSTEVAPMDAVDAKDAHSAVDVGSDTAADTADVKGDAADTGAGTPDITTDTATGPAALASPTTQPMWLTNGAFPKNAAYPSAVAFAPAGLQPAGPLRIVVYLHGHYNCATNVVGDSDSACKPGGSKRPASKLASQLTATGGKALLLVPEVKVDEGSSDPGSFGKAGGFKAFLIEALAGLQPPLVPRKVEDIQTLVVASHSGGYLAAANIATQGGVKVDEVWLLDSLYGAYPSFVGWAKQDLAGFGKFGADWKRRLFVVYTDGGGTVGLSKQLAGEAKGWVPSGAWLHDETTATWADKDYGHGLLFKHSGLSHHGVTTYYFGKLVATSGGLAGP